MIRPLPLHFTSARPHRHLRAYPLCSPSHQLGLPHWMSVGHTQYARPLSLSLDPALRAPLDLGSAPFAICGPAAAARLQIGLACPTGPRSAIPAVRGPARSASASIRLCVLHWTSARPYPLCPAMPAQHRPRIGSTSSTQRRLGPPCHLQPCPLCSASGRVGSARSTCPLSSAPPRPAIIGLSSAWLGPLESVFHAPRPRLVPLYSISARPCSLCAATLALLGLCSARPALPDSTSVATAHKQAHASPGHSA